MLRKILVAVGISVFGGLIMATLVVAKPRPEPQPMQDESTVIEVAVTKARAEAMRLSVNAQGTVRPKREIELVAQVSGRIVNVEPVFVSGGFFDPSQVLLQIEDREYRAAVLQAKTQLAEAEHRLAEERGLSHQAQREWRDLGNASANDLFLRRPQLAAAEVGVESAQAALAVAEMNLENTQVTLPFYGRVKSKHADVGQYVSVGTLLATVYDSTTVEIRLPLTDLQASLLDLPLTAAEARVLGRPKVTLTGTVAGRRHQWEGEITRTDAFVDDNSRMIFAVVEVQDPFGIEALDGQPQVPLLPGVFVDAEIEGRLLDQVLRLPRSALYSRDKLLTLDEQNKITEQRVRVLRRSEDFVWVQGEVAHDAFIALEKQSLTPAGTLVEPVWNTEIAPAMPSDVITQALHVPQED
ncbi:efflux RND transporter periplasmic adaptor subunit [Marinimicrobium sp. ABcell2]|uniref:efflux RND transporter periplasmic adaptor subunit n=1 Tax=Marinimicrobium sp. ABcell2 TaxID=3069751 RepID=UPI0027B407FC|nr:efflux RND transporter periplasmic adaptor subunit [Marinimicrobium sp. ABcell2]MDQ2076822.1 efflux RND transporter periplasmic adaptor subunit [Marinimicrobium sp. ABcell2]